MEEPLLYREEVTAILITLADVNVNVRAIRELLEDEDGEDQEDDA